MGKLYVIDGLDGSGKRTQTELLYKHLKDKGVNVRMVSFPNYTSESSALVKMYLNGGITKNVVDINPYASSAFYACDRYITYLKDLKDFYESGGVILCDRYISSNIIFQTSKIDDVFERRKFINWAYDFETKYMGIPKEDKVIILVVDPEISAKLMTERYKGDEGKKDLHESNIEFLRKCYNNVSEVSKYCGWSKIDCMTPDKSNILPREEIFSMILKELDVE